MKATELRLLTPAEAAVVSCLSVRNVNRAIDEKILPSDLYEVGSDSARLLMASACVFLSFYFEAANRLTSEERQRIIGIASKELSLGLESPLEEAWTIRQDFLTVDLAPFLRTVRQRLAKLSAARALVVEDPEILDGTPVIRGTRVPVYDVAALARAGEPIERILEDYPRLNAEAVELAQIFAEANPQRGRPRQSPALPAGSVIVSYDRVPGKQRLKRAS